MEFRTLHFLRHTDNSRGYSICTEQNRFSRSWHTKGKYLVWNESQIYTQMRYNVSSMFVGPTRTFAVQTT